MNTNTEKQNLEQEERPLFSEEYTAQTILDVKQSHKPTLKTNDKLEQIRRRYLKKISEQPEGYRQQLVANLKDKHEITPELQEQLALE